MKALKPSQKENKRYLLVRGKVSDIEKAIKDFMGTSGMSKVGLGWIESKKLLSALSKAFFSDIKLFIPCVVDSVLYNARLIKLLFENGLVLSD